MTVLKDLWGKNILTYGQKGRWGMKGWEPLLQTEFQKEIDDKTYSNAKKKWTFHTEFQTCKKSKTG